MASYDMGKDVVAKWIREKFPADATMLDVGACDGKWKRILPEYANMDAVEIFRPNYLSIAGLYRTAFNVDIADLEYEWYDLVIFGDVIEHMDVETAQKVLAYAADHCKDMIVAVPFLYPQGQIYGNPWEIHKQPDLTAEIFDQRYPGFEVLHDTGKNYCFYHKKQKASKKRKKKEVQDAK